MQYTTEEQDKLLRPVFQIVIVKYTFISMATSNMLQKLSKAIDSESKMERQ